MLALSAASMGFAPAAPMLRPAVAPATVAMRQSEALPFLESPPQLDGTLAGDVGFDPLNLSGYYSLDWMREVSGTCPKALASLVRALLTPSFPPGSRAPAG